MTATVTDLAVRSLAGVADLGVERTQYRGHARELAAATAADLVIVHGGDGSINEVVNGVMGRGADLAAGGGRPLIAVIPGGGANVLARALGVPLEGRRLVGVVLRLHRAATGRRLSVEGGGGRRVGGPSSAALEAQARLRAWAGTPRWCGRWTGCARRATGRA